MNANLPMTIKEFYLKDLAACRTLAAQLAPLLKTGDIVTLNGTLGAGKTEFCRAIIHALGYDEDVPSPTFNLVQVYEPALDDLQTPAVWHMDLYRLENEEDVFELGVEDAFDTAVTLIEWPEKMGRFLPKGHLRIEMEMTATENERTIKFTGEDYWKQRLGALEI